MTLSAAAHRSALAGAAALFAACGAPTAPAADEGAAAAIAANAPETVSVETPTPNPRRGRILFIAKGCVICHQVNSVGGAAAPALDWPTPRGEDGVAVVRPLDFAAGMWRGAEAMTALQAIELGYIIDIDAQDLLDLAAFTSNDNERELLTLESTPKEMRDWFIDTPYWRLNEWEDYQKRGERIPFDDELPQE